MSQKCAVHWWCHIKHKKNTIAFQRTDLNWILVIFLYFCVFRERFFFFNISWLFPNTGNDVNGKSCFCRDVDECPPKGTIDLFRCNGSPMFISLPHFYLADPKLVKNIRSGLTPYEKSHESFILFELVQFLTMFWHRVQV